MADQFLLLISRDDILSVADGDDGDRLFRLLARLTRTGFQLLATAPQPDDWSRDHGGPDDALLGPDSIRNRLSSSGGDLDGIYYVPRSLITQKRNQEEAFRDMMERYGTDASRCHLYSSSRKFVDAANELDINATLLDSTTGLMGELDTLYKKYSV